MATKKQPSKPKKSRTDVLIGFLNRAPRPMMARELADRSDFMREYGADKSRIAIELGNLYHGNKVARIPHARPARYTRIGFPGSQTVAEEKTQTKEQRLAHRLNNPPQARRRNSIIPQFVQDIDELRGRAPEDDGDLTGSPRPGVSMEHGPFRVSIEGPPYRVIIEGR